MARIGDDGDRRAGRARLSFVRGGGVQSLCVWKEGQARSPREAKRLLEEGCAALEEPSERIELYLESVRESFGELFAGAAFIANRICLVAHTREARLALRELGDLAWCTGLSLYEPPHTVRVAMRADDALALSRAVSLLSDGQALEVDARCESLVMSVRLDEQGRFEARSPLPAASAHRFLSLLGFEAGHGSLPYRRAIRDNAFDMGKLLSRAFLPMCTEDDDEIALRIEGAQTLRLCAYSA